jgi:hypothetical protein
MAAQVTLTQPQPLEVVEALVVNMAVLLLAAHILERVAETGALVVLVPAVAVAVVVVLPDILEMVVVAALALLTRLTLD